MYLYWWTTDLVNYLFSPFILPWNKSFWYSEQEGHSSREFKKISHRINYHAWDFHKFIPSMTKAIFFYPDSYFLKVECTLNQMKTIWQSKKSSKSVGSIFNQFNAFWALSYILINILALFFIYDYYKWFLQGGYFWPFYSINDLKSA